MNKERYFAEQAALERGWVIDQKKSNSMLKMIGTVRNHSDNKFDYDRMMAKFICRYYID